MEETQYQVYVIRNEENLHYIGLSEDMLVRLEQHNKGISKWTRGKGPWKLVWSSGWMDLSAATRLERKLKAQKGGAGF